MFKQTSVKKYLLRTLILLLALALFLVCFYPLVMDGDANRRMIYFIIIGCIVGATLIAYWVYIFVREYRIAHGAKKPSKKEKKDE